jgi:sugar phosphate isomerase/epimerase
MEIFISTGGYRNIEGTKIFQQLRSAGIKNVEFSGGKSIKNFEKSIKKFKYNSQIHNYFPPPKKPFVFNLSSENKQIASKSLNLVKKNIILSKKLGAKYYSFHAGFRVDPNPKQLGKKFKKTVLIKKEKALKNFYNKLKVLIKFAKKYQIKLLIENNVITKKNFQTFKTNPFLLTTPGEIKSFFKEIRKFNDCVGLLLDVAHLKVSSKTLGFHLEKAHNSLKKLIIAYHLSDNDGKSDSNKKFTSRSWFWKYFKKQVEYVTIEVYGISMNEYLKLQNLIKTKCAD